MSRGPTSSPIVNARIEARARQLAEERPWASHADNLRRAEDLLRGEFAPKPKKPVDQVEAATMPKVRKTVEVVVKDGTFFVVQEEGSLVDYGPAEDGDAGREWFVKVDDPAAERA